MPPTTPPVLPIESYPVLWRNALSHLIGPGTFEFSATRNSIPAQWLGLISSHSSRLNFANTQWQTSLQSALLLATRQRWGVLFAAETPYAAAIVHSCDRLGVPWIDVTSDRTGTATRTEPNRSAAYCGTIVLSPLAHGPNAIADLHAIPLHAIPLHDRAVAFLSDRLFALEVRRGGKVENLLQARLKHREIPSATTYVSLPHSAQSTRSPKNQNDLLSLGAIGWIANDSQANVHSASWAQPPDNEPSTYQPIIPLLKWRQAWRHMLCHCTRARSGPWPDQSLDQFHDELLQSPWDHAPTPRESLQRILRQQRLLATSQLRRGPLKTVCFSERPIHELLSMRRFQSHIARWDWEPYGILIDRDWLIEEGAKAVQYLSASEASQLGPDEVAFAQVIGAKQSSIDWTLEREWRIANDIRLNRIPASKAFVFVATVEDARQIQSLSRWPVLVASTLQFEHAPSRIVPRCLQYFLD